MFKLIGTYEKAIVTQTHAMTLYIMKTLLSYCLVILDWNKAVSTAICPIDSATITRHFYESLCFRKFVLYMLCLFFVICHLLTFGYTFSLM